MFCPYCKKDLKLKNEELYCSSGDCYFSKNISNHFAEKISSILGRKQINNCEGSRDGCFYCVSCGSEMTKVKDMHEVCMNCGFEIDKSTYYRIIERNPHK